MAALAPRSWVPATAEARVQSIAAPVGASPADALEARVRQLVEENRQIHERDCVNLDPAANVMNPRAEALLAQGLSSRPSLGWPGAKYETGLEAIEQIEVLAAELAAEIFHARYAEIRVTSGAFANLCAFMAITQPGDAIIVPSAAIGGHVTHRRDGVAGLYGLQVHEAPIDAGRFTVDLDRLAALARTVRPKLITLGGSLNPFEHPVAEVRGIADQVGARVMFDAAHQCGLIAGGAWRNPLADGADLMTMSTYKSLGGPAGGLIVTNDAGLAERLDAIVHPGMTANFDAARAAALALTLLDWRQFGAGYARAMIATAQALAASLDACGLAVHGRATGFTASHQFALEAAAFGGGQRAARHLRQANILACGIGLPISPLADDVNGLRLGTPEIVRWGMAPQHMPELASLIARGLAAGDVGAVAADVRLFRSRFTQLHYVR